MNVEVSLTDDPDSVEVYQDLDLILLEDDNANVRKALIEAAIPPWKHAKERERATCMKDRVDDRTLAFERREGNGLVRVWVDLFPCKNCYRVVSILPVTEDDISLQKYNRALRDFVSRVVEPASEKSAFRYTMSTGKEKPEDWLGQKAGTALRHFSDLANRETGNSDSLDWERWMNFVSEASKSEKALHSDLIRTWLREVEGWSEEFAHSLTIDYIKGVELLRYHNRIGAEK